MSAVTTLAVDQASPDFNILDAYEKLRQLRAESYRLSDLNVDRSDADEEKNTAEEVALEDVIDGECATTIPGIVAQIQRMMPLIDNAAWIDRGLAEHGLMALMRHKASIEEWTARQIVEILHELVNIEWESRRAAYERDAAAFAFSLKLKGVVEAELFRQRSAGGASEFVAELARIVDEAESQFDSEASLRRLIRTVTPDQDEYRRKVAIIIAEGVEEDVTPWLARDAEFLMGGLAADLSKGGK